MKLITERTLVRDVATRWRATYPLGSTTYGADKQEIGRKLEALDPDSVTAADAAAIIGNNSWTTVPKCDECGESTAAVMQLGEEPDYDSATVNVCISCLRLALSTFVREV